MSKIDRNVAIVLKAFSDSHGDELKLGTSFMKDKSVSSAWEILISNLELQKQLVEGFHSVHGGNQEINQRIEKIINDLGGENDEFRAIGFVIGSACRFLADFG